MQALGWLSQEAHRIHSLFEAIFYALITVFLLIGVLVEYFKFPLGGMPSFGPLVGRALIAVLLLHSYPDVANLAYDLTSALSTQLGELTQITKALEVLSDKVEKFTWSWTSVRQSVIVIISYLSFLLLYFSVHVAQAIYLYSSSLLYIFSPLLIALFVLPSTASATRGLYQSLFEMSMWKPVWCVIATIIWSTGVSDIQAEGSGVSFLSAICFCLIAAASLVTTPIVVHMLAATGISAMGQTLSRISIPGFGAITPLNSVRQSLTLGKRTANTALLAADISTRKYFPKANEAITQIPKFRTPKGQPIFQKKPHKKEGKS